MEKLPRVYATRANRTVRRGWAMIVLTALAGCQGTKSSETKPLDRDPLYGAVAPPVDARPLPGTNTSGVASGPTGTLGTPTSMNQPLAQPTSVSPAVLATGSYPPLAGGQDLRIGQPPATGGNRVLPRNQTPPGVIAVVTADPDFGKPREAVPGVTPLDDSGRGPAPPPGSAVGGLESALQSVAAMNPKWHKLENAGSGVWRFTCSIPDRQEPSKSRNYEAEGATALAAVQNVLDRANRDR